MLEARTKPLHPLALPCLSLPRLPDQLWVVIYRSHPRDDLGERGYAELLHQARHHNLAAGISGVLVHGKDASGSPVIVQWLEGPEMAVRDLMGKIAADPRHNNISIMDSFPVHDRLFGNWSMLFADEDPEHPIIVEQGLLGRTHALADLGTGSSVPQDIFTSLSQVARDAAEPDDVPPGRDSNLLRPDAQASTEDLIENLLASPFLPAVAERASRNGQERPLLISAITHLVLSHDLQTLETVLRRGSTYASDPLAAQILLLEQTERRLGDMWETDECSEADITLALLEMVSAMRTIHLGAQPRLLGNTAAPAVLVISEPGEFHLLPAVLDAEVLYQRGWQPQLDFPDSDQVLIERLGREWFEAVDISLSDVFRREHWLQRLAVTVAKIRANSLNRHIAITVSGRIFRDRHSLLAQTGADRLVLSASEIEWSITEALKVQGTSVTLS